MFQGAVSIRQYGRAVTTEWPVTESQVECQDLYFGHVVYTRKFHGPTMDWGRCRQQRVEFDGIPPGFDFSGFGC
jgi:hypothetical protein